jgi:glycosyltransferase involved in cell wall biosynthesis
VAGDPEVAVVVGAYRRSEHLAAAVRSVLAQTLPRDRFEVVISKTFTDPVQDAAFRAAGILLREDATPAIGRWLRNAVRATRAPLVTFLDDDDEYEPDRLARIVELGRARPDVGFYRNRVRVIDRDSRPVPPGAWRVHETEAGLDASGPVYRARTEKAGAWEFGARRGWATFNSSSMAIRRELLDGPVGDAFDRTYQPDQFLFLAGLLAPFGLYLDDRRLTRYRYYGGNVSLSLARLRDWSRSEHEMADVARTGGETEFGAWLDREADHYERMFRGGSLMQRIGDGAGRREVAQRTAAYLRFLATHPAERSMAFDTWAAGLYGIAYVGAPALTRPVARARSAARAAGEGRPDPLAPPRGGRPPAEGSASPGAE